MSGSNPFRVIAPDFVKTMIRTNPSYVDADGLTLSEYARQLFRRERPAYSSAWRCWRSMTLFWALPLIVVGSVWVAAMTSLMEDEGAQWAMLGVYYLLFAYTMGALLSVYYFYYVPWRISCMIVSFLHDCFLPDARDITRLKNNNYTALYHNRQYEIAYSEVVESERPFSRSIACMFVCLYFAPKPPKAGEMFKDGHLTESFLDEWNAYCEDKASCRNLFMEDYVLYAAYPVTHLPDGEQFRRMIEEVEYIIRRFDLIPLRIHKTESEVRTEAQAAAEEAQRKENAPTAEDTQDKEVFTAEKATSADTAQEE